MSDIPRIALIFPPAVHPTSPPLGVAALKAYLEHESVPGSVRVFDLNLAHYEQALRWMGAGRLKMSLRKMDHETTALAVSEVFSLFRGSEGLGAFLDPARYESAASLYRSFETVLNGLFDSFCRKILAELPVPPLVSSYFDELVEPLRAFRPRLAGFSLLFSQQLTFASAIAKLIRKDETRVVFGGATLSVMPQPEDLLSRPIPIRVGDKTHEIRFSRCVDHLVVGEGETALAALIEHLEDGDISRIPGLVTIRHGSVHKNPPRMIEYLDGLPPPDFSDLPLGGYHSPSPTLPYLSSRGCFWGRCAFCTHQKTYLAYREESVERTVENLSILRDRHGTETFNLVDEMIHANRFNRLSQAILDRKLRIRYSAYAKPTRGFSPTLLRKIYLSGARVLMWGIESGNQRVLDLMRKGTHADEMKAVMNASHDAGIWNLVFLLFGFPSETAGEWTDTLDFLEEIRDSVDALSKSRFVLLAGSDILANPGSYGITRVLDRLQRDPVSVAFDYEVTGGLSQSEARQRYESQMPALARYGRSPYFAQYRDHLLITARGDVADHPGIT